MTNCLRTVDKPASCMGESGMATGEPTVTTADRIAAAEVAGQHESWCHYVGHSECCGLNADFPEQEMCDCDLLDRREAIATALAAEREKVRAEFLAVADELDAWETNAQRYIDASERSATTAAMARARIVAYRRATGLIRLAAKSAL